MLPCNLADFANYRGVIRSGSGRDRTAVGKLPCRVGDTGIEPVTSSVSGKRATAAPIAHADPEGIRKTMVFTEVGTGFEPVYTALQAAASPLGQPTV